MSILDGDRRCAILSCGVKSHRCCAVWPTCSISWTSFSPWSFAQKWSGILLFLVHDLAVVGSFSARGLVMRSVLVLAAAPVAVAVVGGAVVNATRGRCVIEHTGSQAVMHSYCVFSAHCFLWSSPIHTALCRSVRTVAGSRGTDGESCGRSAHLLPSPLPDSLSSTGDCAFMLALRQPLPLLATPTPTMLPPTPRQFVS